MDLKRQVDRILKGNTNVQWKDSYFIQDSGDWDLYKARMMRYYLNQRYYDNTVYSGLNRFITTLRKKLNLYRHTRAVYNPVNRAVEGVVGAVYGGRMNYTDMGNSAIPIKSEDPTELEAIKHLFQVSRMGDIKNDYVRNGAKLADSYLKVVDDDSGVYIEAIDPRQVGRVEKDTRGNVTRSLITWVTRDVNGSELHYVEEMTLDTIRTFVMDTPPDFDSDLTGGVLAVDDDGNAMEYDNPYGFVPLVHVPFNSSSDSYGVSLAWDVRFKIDEVNSLASTLHDDISNALVPLFHAKGVAKGALTTNQDEDSADSVRILYTQGNAELHSLMNNIAVADNLTLIQELTNEIQTDLPIMELQSLLGMSTLTAPAVRLAMSGSIIRIEEIQSKFDETLKQVICMALSIGGMRNLYPFKLEDYTNGTYQFYIGDRDILNDSLSKQDIVTTLATLDPSNPLATLILRRLGFTDNEIEEYTTERGNVQSNQLRTSILSAQAGNLSALRATGARIRNNLNTGESDE